MHFVSETQNNIELALRFLSFFSKRCAGKEKRRRMVDDGGGRGNMMERKEAAQEV